MGEGTCTQLFQSVCGDLNRFNNALLSIRVVWISHHHADHICGLPLLLEHVNRADILARKYATQAQAQTQTTQKIIVIGPPVVLKYQEYCACVAGLDHLVVFVPTVSTLFASYSVPLYSPVAGPGPGIGSSSGSSFGPGSGSGSAYGSGLGSRSVHMSEECGRLLIRSVQVPHCRESYAIVLEIVRHQVAGGGRCVKVVYSGDCRPSSALINAGRDCDILLHEATFDDTMQQDAECKRHCTTSEAVEVGTRMKAKHIVLTHFSQRYPVAVQSYSHRPSQQSTSTTSSGLSTTVSDIATNYNSNSSNSSNAVMSARSFSVAFDLLRFSFPSQVSSLPTATNALTHMLAAAATAEQIAE